MNDHAPSREEPSRDEQDGGEPSRSGSFRVPPRLWIAAIAIAIALTSCLESRPKSDAAPQQWWEERGPVVPHDKFPADCSLCHDSSDWSAVRADFHFDHEAETGVALKGAHAQAECLRCHNDRGPVAMFAGRGCAGCHDDIHEGELGPECSNCHGEDDWNPVGQVANHNNTRFPLVGAHVAAACTECHEGADVGNFGRTNIQCVDCHQADLAQATEPDHQAAGWVDSCNRCHIPTTWKGAGFTHSFFPLTGGHSVPDCTSCHVSGVFQGTSSACSSCHADAYDATSDPKHSTLGFSQQCQECHNTLSWQGALFDHSVFPLTGAHAATACAQCHTNGLYEGTPTNCVDCHLADFNGTSEPDHEVIGFSQNCQQCHNTAAWEGASFDHGSFPLTGAHAATSCSQCHVNGVYIGTPTNCVDCHLADYNATAEPDHESIGFPQDCQQCHNTGTWEGASFNHGSFPLTGAHAATSCSQCHVNGVYIGTPTQCVDCHLADYNGTNDPDHETAGFPQDCQQCHNTGAWEGASFDHGSFPLTGAHAATSCSQCHVNGVYIGTPTQCVDCHLADYNGTNDPDHAAVGFPTSCETCHNSSTWQGAVFNHSFPITSGKHKNFDCMQCHIVPGNTSIFSCIDCHEHNKPDTDDEHNDENGYVYSSPACLACHPDGKD